MSELRLLEGERLILDVSPTPLFKRYVTVAAGFAGLIFLAMVNVLVAMTFYVVTGGAPVTEVGVVPLLVTYALLYLVLAPIVVALAYAFASLMYNKYHYWVTNQRVVWKHGVIGYSITSVPLERISDVAVSRTFWERVCGVGGVVVKEMGAVPKFGYGYWYGRAGWSFPTM
ncbi:MAG: PH domain-containing protein, partial [Candidatus Bathyarchaeia archaeon]